MFYRPGQDDHGLPHDPFKALVAPRPIGWISTRDGTGRNNLAPYSFFNAVSSAPPMVVFAVNGRKGGRVAGEESKDSLTNIRETGVFCVNVVSEALTEAMNVSSGAYARGEDEFVLAGLKPAPCETIDCIRVAESPANLECRLHEIIRLPSWGEAENRLVIGMVTGIHVAPSAIVEGRVDVARYGAVSRLGYMDYAVVRDTFVLNRPR